MSPQRGDTVHTAPDDADARLRGRTYAIPFDQVWHEALALCRGGLRRWQLLEHDDYDGVIKAEARPLLGKKVTEVEIHISLDANGQTRVDLSAQDRAGWFDLGARRRRIEKFCRKLDERLASARGRPVPRL